MEVSTGSVTVRLSPSTTYDVVLIDQNDFSETTSTLVSGATGDLVVPLPEKYTKYDGWFSLNVSYNGSLVYVDTVTSKRPYASSSNIIANISKAISQAQAVTYERLARELINSILGFEFSLTRKKVHLTGTGTDFLRTDERIVKVFGVKENNVTIWSDGDDDPFTSSPGSYSVVRSYNEEQNRAEYSLYNYGGEFRWNFDYEIDAEVGWQVVPQDIQDAAIMLVDDIACGNNRYTNKYIDSFDSGTVKIDYYKGATAGTGNLLVDNILSKYVVESIRAKVL